MHVRRLIRQESPGEPGGNFLCPANVDCVRTCRDSPAAPDFARNTGKKCRRPCRR
jgi:hypothetical protein